MQIGIGSGALHGTPSTLSPNRWRTIDIVKGYIGLLRERARLNSGTANNRLREARAVEIELRTAERLRKLCPIEDFAAFIDLICGAFRSELGSLPARVTRDLPMRRIIEREVNGVLTRVADICAANAARLKQG
jgi:phage terminase Nu1 subunit (DNA packaging protein)